MTRLPDPTEAAEYAARRLAQNHARAIDAMMPRGDGRDTLLNLLALAWLEGARDGLAEGASLYTEALAAAERHG